MSSVAEPAGTELFRVEPTPKLLGSYSSPNPSSPINDIKKKLEKTLYSLNLASFKQNFLFQFWGEKILKINFFTMSRSRPKTEGLCNTDGFWNTAYVNYKHTVRLKAVVWFFPVQSEQAEQSGVAEKRGPLSHSRLTEGEIKAIFGVF